MRNELVDSQGECGNKTDLLTIYVCVCACRESCDVECANEQNGKARGTHGRASAHYMCKRQKDDI